MSMNDTYQPINCDDYDNLELPASIIYTDAGVKRWRSVGRKPATRVSRKNVEYLIVEDAGATRELRLDKIASFSHPQIGTVVVSES
ncbi:Rho-binding antiterminator [Enterobacter cloacae subsp. cloacae]|nr:Rho-binding antiterminator [Enterobacter cloacae subsp. cloacae]